MFDPGGAGKKLLSVLLAFSCLLIVTPVFPEPLEMTSEKCPKGARASGGRLSPLMRACVYTWEYTATFRCPDGEASSDGLTVRFLGDIQDIIATATASIQGNVLKTSFETRGLRRAKSMEVRRATGPGASPELLYQGSTADTELKLRRCGG